MKLAAALRARSPEGGPITVFGDDWDTPKVAVDVCDMWDTTQCVSAARRVVELAWRIK
jgi:hypothetical protein